MLKFTLMASKRRRWSQNHRIAMLSAACLAPLFLENKNKSLVDEQSQEQEYDSLDRNNNSHEDMPFLQSIYNNGHHSISISLPSILEPSTASCELKYALKLPAISRRRTILQLEKASTTKYSLDSKYDVLWKHQLGEGGFGAVYLATNKQTKENVAVKKIPKQLTDDASFQREMNALLHIQEQGGHPHICGLQENFEEGDHYYLVLDLVSGGEMFDHLCSHGPYSEADAARLVREVASALAFLHGIGCVHGDLKPENLMLSTPNPSDAVIKLVDFGISQITDKHSKYFSSDLSTLPANTPGYSPPEVVDRRKGLKALAPSVDIWAIGVIIYIMLAGVHPFDLTGASTDKEINESVLSGKGPPLRNSPITSHLSPSAVDLIEKLMHPNPKKRLTAFQMLNHPWVQGETALTGKIKNSDQRLSAYRKYKTRLGATVFASMVEWTDGPNANGSNAAKRTSLIERSFQMLDQDKRGYITKKQLKRFASKEDQTASSSSSPSSSSEDDDETQQLSLSGFEDLLSENMKNTYFPAGHLIYKEGERGDKMYFINSGRVEVYTKSGFRTVSEQGDFFGEGALLHDNARRSASIKTLTPVHAIEVSREYFQKYIADGVDLQACLVEKDKFRKKQRAKAIFNLQQNMKSRTVEKGTPLFQVGEVGDELYVLDKGVVDVIVGDHTVFTSTSGDIIGEHSVVFNRRRNTSATCASDECVVRAIPTAAVKKLFQAHPAVNESLRDTCLRREFQKALVYRTKKCFPRREEDLREAFEAADVNSSGTVDLEDIAHMLKEYDNSFTDEDIKDILGSLDLDRSGSVSFNEFKRLFDPSK